MSDMYEKYNKGLTGVLYDEDKAEKFLSSLPHPFFKDINTLFGDGKGKLSLPWKALERFWPTFGTDEAQVTGDCVSHGFRNAADITRAFEIVYNGEKETFVNRSATEAIYGSRGFSGEGMYGHQGAEFLTKTGGVLVRQNYIEAGVDLSKYNGKMAAGWGRTGVPKKLIEQAIKHQFKTASLVTSVEEARDLLANGYAISVCSNYGFSNVRDKFGISEASGSWGHCMVWIGVDDTRKRSNETLFLVQNSWGKWNSGPKVDQPEGSFWIREKVAAAMLAQKQSYALSNFDGFQRRMDWSRIREIYR